MAGTAPDFSTDVNPYEVLGLGLGSPQLSAADIKSAYRKKALLLHPDKRKQTERAGAPTVLDLHTAVLPPRVAASHTLHLRLPVAEREFNELQKAYEILWCVRGKHRLSAQCPLTPPVRPLCSDDAARAAWDGYAAARAARAERDRGLDERRKKLKQGTPTSLCLCPQPLTRPLTAMQTWRHESAISQHGAVTRSLRKQG